MLHRLGYWSSRTLAFSFEAMIFKEGDISEKRFQIDILAITQSYDFRELYHLAWIPVEENAADALKNHFLKARRPLPNNSYQKFEY